MNEYQVFKAGHKKGQPKTLTDRVIRYLVEYSKMKEDESPSKKYRKFSIPGKPGYFYFVGKAGAIRFGETIGRSSSITDRVKVFMERWETRLQTTVDKCNQILADVEAERNINCLDGVVHEEASQ